MRFQSAPLDGVALRVETPDLRGFRDGETDFIRQYEPGEVVVVEAPGNVDGLGFYRWVWPGGYSTNARLSVRSSDVERLTVVYGDGCRFEPSYVGELERLLWWSRMPVRVYFDRSGVDAAEVSAAREGMSWWNDRLGGIVRWVEVGDLGSADVVVRWDAELEAPYVGWTSFRFDVGSGRLLSAEIRILPGLDRDMARSIGAHEFGHALGIWGHSSDWNDLMYSTYTGFNMSGVSLRDANTVRTGHCHLFGGSRSAAPGRGEASEARILCGSGSGG
jgi:hypothetical protein